MENELFRLSASEASERIKNGDFTAVELTRSCLNQIERHEANVRAWAYLNAELALDQARAIDKKLAAQERTGPLAGVPVGIKDIFNTKEMPTQMGSPIWRNFTPGNDARVVHYLKMADAVLIGKTVTAEFAVHAPGPTLNPHNPEYMPGTSSSGSAAAVAAYMIPLALGTQTAGSTIRPASYCGVYGFKPSFGVLPRTGMLKTTDSLDTIGLFARTIEDVETLFDTVRVSGADYPFIHALLDDPERRKKPNPPWRVGIVKGPKWHDAEPYAQQALFDFAKELSEFKEVEVEEVVLPTEFERAHEIHATIYDRTLAYYFKEEFKQKTLVSDVIYEIINHGNEITLDQYRAALEEQDRLAEMTDSLFAESYDVILNLSTSGTALKGLDSVDRPDNCLIWTLCGIPALNLPVFVGPNRLPFGLQAITRRYDDYLLLNFARWLRQNGLAQDGANPPPPQLNF